MILLPRSVRFTAAPSSITLVRDTGEKQMLKIAREEGLCAGREEATQACDRQNLEQRAETAHLQETTLNAISRQFESLTEDVRRALPSLALEIARRALAGIVLDADQVRRIADETLAEMAPGTIGVILKLSPQDHRLVEKLAAEFAQKYPGLVLIADPELQSGDCVASSHFGTIDARLAGKLENIARALL